MTVRETSHGQSVPQSNGYARTNRQSAVYSSAPSWGGEQNASHGTNGESSKARYPHIKDLLERAEVAVRNLGTHVPVRQPYDALSNKAQI